jgi:Zn finger protein HypA/HybF involved in hydrogenase expression
VEGGAVSTARIFDDRLAGIGWLAGTGPQRCGLHIWEEHMATEAYCVKCREKREMKDEEEVTMKNGRPAIQGICPICGTKLFRIKSTKKAD